MTERMDFCPKCGQQMHIDYDAKPMYFYHPVWVSQDIDPPCTNTVSYEDMMNHNQFQKIGLEYRDIIHSSKTNEEIRKDLLEWIQKDE